MARRARANALLLIFVLTWAGGFAVAGTLSPAVWEFGPGLGPFLPGWTRPALAQRPGDELQPSEWQRLAGPLPYRPNEPDSGSLSENDLTRAVDLIADLGLFFAKLSETDPNAQARRVWAQGEAAYASAAEALRSEIQDGRFRIVVSQGSRLALTRRGEEIWVDADLAGAWDAERVRRARRSGDDWPDVAGLSGMLFDLWRARESSAGDAWLDHQLKSIAADAALASGKAGAVLTRYGFLKDLFLKASLLRAATTSSANAALWRNRAQGIKEQIEALITSGSTAALSGDWAAYETQIDQTSAERTWLVLAARRPALSRVGQVLPKPEQDPGRTVHDEATGPHPEATEDVPPVPVAERQPADPRDRDYIALLLARTADAARAATTAEERPDVMARQADAARLAADDARRTLEAAQTGSESAAEEAAALAAERDQVQSEAEALQARLAEAEAAQAAAERQAADLSAQLATARSGSAQASQESERLSREIEAVAAERDQARAEAASLQNQLAEAEAAQKVAEQKAADLGAQLAPARSGSAGAAEETARLNQEIEAVAAERDQARAEAEALQTQLAKAQTSQASAEQEAADLAAQLTEAENRASAAETAAADARAESAELQRQLATREATAATAEAQAAAQSAALAEAEAETARLASELETLRAAAADAEARGAAEDAERAALQSSLADLRQELTATQSQAATAAAALHQEQARADELAAGLAAAQDALAAAQTQAQAESARAVRAEAEALAAGESVDRLQRDLAAGREELTRLREEIRTSDQESQTAAVPPEASRTEQAAAPSWLARNWDLAALLLTGALAILWAIRRRHMIVAQPAPERPSASGIPASSVAETVAAGARQLQPQPPERPAARAGAIRVAPSGTVTATSLVDAVRRQDWAAAEIQFAELSGLPSPPLVELMQDPSGEMLALACRAADLDRLTFAALYLLQGQGRAVADPEIVAEAVGLFEKTSPAEARQRLAERPPDASLSA